MNLLFDMCSKNYKDFWEYLIAVAAICSGIRKILLLTYMHLIKYGIFLEMRCDRNDTDADISIIQSRKPFRYN